MVAELRKAELDDGNDGGLWIRVYSEGAGEVAIDVGISGPATW